MSVCVFVSTRVIAAAVMALFFTPAFCLIPFSVFLVTSARTAEKVTLSSKHVM